MSELSKQEIQYELLHAHDDRRPDLIAAYTACLVLAYIAVTLRFIARRKSKNALMADDWTLVVALLFTSGQVAVGAYGMSLGAGKHIIFLKDPVMYIKGFILIEVFYTIAAAIIKFSTLLLYRRIFGFNRNLMIACWIVAGVVTCYSTAQIVMSIFECIPVHKAWDPATPGSCLDTFDGATTPAAFNVVADFATVFLPMPLIWGMQMQWRRKVQLLGIFMLGGFVVFASIWRAATMKDLSHLDASWANADPCIWSIIENGIGIFSTCLPTLRPLYAIAVRGHYCRSNEYCIRCHDAPRGPESTLQRFWNSSSSGARQGSDQTNQTATTLATSKKADIENQWSVTGDKGQQPQLFSIMNQPL